MHKYVDTNLPIIAQGLDKIAIDDLDKLGDPSYTPSPVNSDTQTLHHMINSPSRLELLDTVKPAARAARERAAKSRFSVIGPGVARRQQQTRNKIAQIELSNLQAKDARNLDVQKQDERRKRVDAVLRRRQSQENSILGKFGYAVQRLPGMLGSITRSVTAGKL